MNPQIEANLEWWRQNRLRVVCGEKAAMVPDKPHKARPWGYKGPHNFPQDAGKEQGSGSESSKTKNSGPLTR